MELEELEMTCSACPSQWQGKLTDGRTFYARYRWGIMRVDIDGSPIFSKDFKEHMGGSMSTCFLKGVLTMIGFENIYPE